MGPRVALGSAGLLVVLAGVFVAGHGLERRLARLLETKLAKKLGAPVTVGGVGLDRRGLEARDVLIEAKDRGAMVTLDRVSLGWNRVDIEGADIALDAGVVFQAGPPERRKKESESLARSTFWKADSVRFEDVSLSLSSPEGTRKIATLRGELSSGGESFHGSFEANMREGTLQADARFSASGDARGVQFQGNLDLRARGFAWEPVSRGPVSADARVELSGSWDGTHLSISRGLLRARDAELLWSGNLVRDNGGPLAELDLRLPRTDCQNAVDSIPSGVMGEFSGFVLDGTIEGRLRLQLAPGDPGRTRFEVELRDGCRFRKAPPAAELARVRGPFTHRVVFTGLDGRGQETLAFETGPSSSNWVPLSEVSPFFLHAVLAQEDAQFLAHDGFLPDAFEAALARNLEEGRFASGGSTISMQLARNLFLGREKTLSRKVQEMVLTWWLEKSLSKKEILELYVNVIEFGPRIYGIGPASGHYFGRSASSLSPAEAAFLATLLPAPARRHRDYERGRLSSWGRARVEQLLRRMWSRGRIDEEALGHGLAEAAWLGFHSGSAARRFRQEKFGSAAFLPFS